jgi:hypothetical protein
MQWFRYQRVTAIPSKRHQMCTGPEKMAMYTMQISAAITAPGIHRILEPQGFTPLPMLLLIRPWTRAAIPDTTAAPSCAA